MANLPVGATFGSLVHAVLEHADPAARRLPRRAARPHRRAAGLVAGRARPRGARRRAGRGVRLAAGRSGRPAGRGDAARRPARRTGCARWTSSCRSAGGDVRDRTADVRPVATWPRCSSGTCPRATRCGRTPCRCAARSATSRCAATSPARSTWCCACRRADGPRFHVVDYKTNWLGPDRRAADRRGLPARGDGRRDGALRLPAAGPAVRRRAAPLPALAAAGLRPRAAPRRGALPLRPRHVRARRPRSSTGSRAGCSPGARRCRSSRSSPTCWPGGWCRDDRAVRADQRARLAAGARPHRAAGRVQRRAAAHRRRPPRRRAASARSAARTTSGCCWRWRWPCARSAAGRSACRSTRSRADGPRPAVARRRTPGRTPYAARRWSTPGVLRWDRPDLLYLDRYHRLETQVRDDLVARAAQPPPVVDEARLAAAVAQVRGEHASPEQVEAAATAVRRWTTILTGGPGTGKTTTVARMLALLADQAAARGERISVALTAPTGKAASRLQEAVTARAGRADRRAGGASPCSAARRASPCTGCSAGGPTTRPGSGTTAATGSSTTWSWSTSRRWSS